MQMRKCTSKWHKEERTIPLLSFARDNNRKDGYHNHCKSCRRIARKNWYDTNIQEIKESQKDNYYLDHNNKKAKARIISGNYKKKRGIPWALIMSVKTRAKKRNIEFSLVEQDLIIPKYCPILGIPMITEVGPRLDGYPTVDRIHNDKGYTINNIQIISWRANNLKGAASLDEMIKLGEYAKQLKTRRFYD